MPRTVCLIAFSSSRRDEEKRKENNQDLALETERAIQRFRQDNREENNLELLLVAEREVANILSEEQGIKVDLPIGCATLNENLTPEQLANFLTKKNVKEVIIVAPFWKLGRCRRLFRKLGFILIKMEIKRIGF